MHQICSTKYARNMHKYAYEKYAIYVHNKPKICINMHLYADICVICLNMHEGKYAIICIFKYAEICTKYAAICSTKYAGICTNKQTRNMQYMCIISINMLKYAKTKYAHICKNTICINMHKICTNMQIQICINMHFQNMHKYVFYTHNYA